MNKKLCKILSILMIIAILAISTQTFYADEEEINYGFMSDHQNRLGFSADAPLNGFSSSYDPRNNNIATPVKQQGEAQLCWMYATTGALEQYISLKRGSKLNFSDLHGGLALSKSIIPFALSPTDEYYQNDYDTHLSNAATALQYFTNWNEPILENNTTHWKAPVLNSLFTPHESNKSYLTPSFESADSVINVTGAVHIQNDSNSIKYAILNFGGVITSISHNSINLCHHTNNGSALFNSSNPEDYDLNHEVVIVGWDDNYSVTNFLDSNRPNSNGAWLVRNSNSSNDEYYWLSYEEGSLFHNESEKVVITNIQKSSYSEKMLSYDFKPLISDDTYTNDTVYFCNVYNTANYSNTYDEITKVMFYLKNRKYTYQIRVIPLSNEANLPTDLTEINSYSVLATGTFSNNFEGYITKELSQPVNITNADKCAIIIKAIPTSSDSKIYYPYEEAESKINAGESFIGIEGNNGIDWTDLYSSNPTNNGNLCIRPVLDISSYEADDSAVTISPAQVVATNSDVEIQVSSINRLICIHTPSNYYLREGLDYLRTNNVIVLKQGFLNALYGNYAPLVFEFNDDIAKNIYVNPSAINNVQIVGQPIVGETLTAQLSGQPALTSYDVDYQWEYFDDTENNWFSIPGATQSSYVIDETYLNNYLRVKVNPQPNGNVITGNTSNSTEYQAVILGDCNLDGCVDSFDALQIQKYSAGRVDFDDRQLLAADFNKDGVVDSLDSSAIMVYINT